MVPTHLLSLNIWLAWSVKGSLIILIALVAALLLRRAPAAARHAVLVIAISAQLLLPVARFVMRERTAVLPLLVPIPRSSAVMLAPVTTVFTRALPTISPTGASFHATAPAKAGWSGWLSAVLTLGTLLTLVRLAIGVVAASRIARHAARVSDQSWLALLASESDRFGFSRAIGLRLTSRVDLPVTLGAFRPVILLPADCHRWPAAVRRQVLIHELAHIARKDFVTQFVAQLGLALFWFNPLVHIAVRKIRGEAENACDDAVLRAGVRPSVYANTLLALSAAAPAGLPPFGAVAMGGPPRLEERVRAIVSASRDSSRRNVLLVAASIGLLGIVLPLTAIEQPESGTGSSSLPVASRRQEIDCKPVYVKNAPFRETSGKLTLDDGTSSYYFFRRPEAGRCLEASFSLDARFTADDRDLAVTPALHALVREKYGDFDRIAVITESAGELQRTIRINGHDEPWSSSADRWYHSVMPEMIRLSSAGIDSRVQRILNDSGLSGLTAELPNVGDDGVREQYLAALLSLRSPAELPREELIATAQTALRGYEPSMASLLSEIVTREGMDASIRAAVLSATARLRDGADRNTVLETMASDRDVRVRRSALSAIDLLPGDVWHRLFLDRASLRYLDGDGALIDEYFAAVAGIDGSVDRAMLLEALLSRNPSPEVLRHIAVAAKDIRDPDERAEIERKLARAI